jgi:hypothetical protein
MTHTTDADDDDTAERSAAELADLATELEIAADEADSAARRFRDKADTALARSRACGDPAIHRRSRDTARRRELRAKALRSAALMMRERADTAREQAAMMRYAER